MTKTDKILEEVWNSKSRSFKAISEAVWRLLEGLIETAVDRGVSVQVATETYADWLRTHMREESFLT